MTELQTLWERQRATNTTLVLPLQVWDGNHYPPDVRQLQMLDWNPWGTLSGRDRTKQRWQKTVRDLATQVAAMVAAAPALDPAWDLVDGTPHAAPAARPSLG